MPGDPTSPRGGDIITDETVRLQVQQFLDEWHYRILHSSLAKCWNRKRCVHSALDIFMMNGCDISPEERETLTAMPEEDMVNALVQKMPNSIREGLDHLSLEIHMVTSFMSRVRQALDEKQDALITEVLEESDRAGIAQTILKQSIVEASKEVSVIKGCQNSWIHNTDERLKRLMSAAELAEHAQQQLLAVQSQLTAFQDDHKKNSKKMLVGLADGNDKTLVHSVFTSWLGCMMKMKSEKVIRDKYEAQIAHFENTLIQYQEKQLANVKNVLGRRGADSDEMLLHCIYEAWMKEVEARKKGGDSAEKLKEMENRIAEYQKAHKDNAKQVMARMTAGNDKTLVNMIFQTWVSWHADYQKNKEMEEAVKAEEKKIAEYMKSHSESAKQNVERMMGATNTGLMASCMQHWVQFLKEEKQERQMEAALGAAQDKFKSMQSRHLGNAKGVQTRVNDQMNMNLSIRCLAAWAIETKVNRVDKHYNHKIEAKRRQLASVQSLFKSFAVQLEQGLGDPGETSSRRNTRRSQSQTVAGSQSVVSLPDIHARPVPAN
eukprot:gnl/TRDRNA2_/TRDRNA2_130553_c0_seq1.p1 gnl/TRDRNA2_/TRDRNA2_130553_c0~~gnl/TRDRNA2_/TRDRNA2_130553_c0_seq1.p1  ORF type:complete len:574 (-),score=121.04 gnl/TRDRNA2_/TRDRNA2_130553_c0_seq1:53-1693(-)